MATPRQKSAARKNVRRAASSARRKRTLSRLPKSVRSALAKEGAKARRRRP